MNRCAKILAIGFCLLISSCTNLFLYPDNKIYYTPEVTGLQFSDVAIKSEDGKDLHAWFLPAAVEAKGTVLFLHGNAGNVSTHLSAVHWLPATGYNVLLLDYGGFGQSEGSATVVDAHKDAELALGYLVESESGPIFIFGQSFGASVALMLGAYSSHRGRIAAIVADSAFSSYRGIADEKLSSAWLTWPFSSLLAKTISDQYSAVKAVKRISPIPILFVHTKDDSVVPSHHTELLYAEALDPKSLLIAEGDLHISVFQSEANREALLAFFEQHRQ